MAAYPGGQVARKRRVEEVEEDEEDEEDGAHKHGREDSGNGARDTREPGCRLTSRCSFRRQVVRGRLPAGNP